MKKIYSIALTAACVLALAGCSSTKEIVKVIPTNTSTKTGMDAIPQEELAKANNLNNFENGAFASFKDAELTEKGLEDKYISISTDEKDALNLLTTGEDKALAVNFNLGKENKTHKLNFTFKEPISMTNSFISLCAYIPGELAYLNENNFNSSIKVSLNGQSLEIADIDFVKIGAGWKYFTLNFDRGTYTFGDISGQLKRPADLDKVSSIEVEVEGKEVNANLNAPVIMDFITIVAVPEK